MSTIIKSFALKGVDAYPVDIEINTSPGKPSMMMIGLADQAIKEAGERIRAAIEHLSIDVYKGKIVFNLAPSDVKKTGTHFDLPMALGLLVQDEKLISSRIEYCAFFGELGLDGKLRTCKGILPLVVAAKEAGICNIIVPRANMQEAALVDDICVMGFDTLKEVIDLMTGEGRAPYHEDSGLVQPLRVNESNMCFSDVLGQQEVVEKAVIAAAGGHNLLLIGEPGCGKSMIASRLPTILPDMSSAEALEVTKIYSIAGLLVNKGNLITERPFRAPHHSASLNALIGGGRNAMPGEISLAHNGVLFLDEMPEYSRRTIDSLRQPMEDKRVQITRVNDVNTYPANFMLVGAMNPCPCGYHGSPRCTCTETQVRKYRQKLSGPIMDRIDIIEHVKPVDFLGEGKLSYNEQSCILKERVESARKIQRHRFADFPDIHCNAQMNAGQLKEYCELDAESLDFLKETRHAGDLSARRYTRMLRVARTLADMDERAKINIDDIRRQ